jgi:hypothetical protein
MPPRLASIGCSQPKKPAPNWAPLTPTHPKSHDHRAEVLAGRFLHRSVMMPVEGCSLLTIMWPIGACAITGRMLRDFGDPSEVAFFHIVVKDFAESGLAQHYRGRSGLVIVPRYLARLIHPSGAGSSSGNFSANSGYALRHASSASLRGIA